jgi:hypothetical protein
MMFVFERRWTGMRYWCRSGRDRRPWLWVVVLLIMRAMLVAMYAC